MNEFKKFTSIEKFSDVWMLAQKMNVGKLFMRSKIKLHGTNAGVRICDGIVTAQKRTEDVTVLKDNAGFAFWVSKVSWKLDKNIIIFGEWAGPGVQKSDAISLIDKKRFFVFGVLIIGTDDYVVEPELIKEYLPEHEDIYVLPWFDEAVEIDTDDVETARMLSARLETQVEQIGNEDPYVKHMFSVSGSGEGLVIGPYDPSGIVSLVTFNSFVFKVKSEAHAVKKTSSPASIRVEVPSSVKDFAKTFVTDARCEQMINEHCGGSYSSKVIGDFLKNISIDILKESKNELAEMNVEWKLIAKEINNEALAWFKSKNII